MGCCDDNEVASTRKGPRKEDVCCTDIICLILFIAVWGGLIAIAVLSIQGGNAARLLYGYDSFGNTCNVNNKNIDNVSLSGQDTTGKRYGFFLDGFMPGTSLKICVQKCPQEKLTSKNDIYNYYKMEGEKLCLYNVDPETYLSLPDSAYSRKGPCPQLPVYPSYAQSSQCIPDPSAIISPSTPSPSTTSRQQSFSAATDMAVVQMASYEQEKDIFTKVLEDVYACSTEIIYLALIALAMSFVLVLIMHCVAAIMVWVAVIGAAIGSIAGCVMLWIGWCNAKKEKKLSDSGPVEHDDIQQANEILYLTFAIIWTIITVFTLIILFSLRDSLKLAVKLFKEAKKCVLCMPLILLQPLLTFAILAGFIAFWMAVIAYIVTMDVAFIDTRGDFDVAVVSHTRSAEVVGYFWFYLVGAIWMEEYILAAQQFVVAGAVGIWYFLNDKGRAMCAPRKAMTGLLFHHLGSVAAGSIILVLVKLPRWILNYLRKKLHGSESLLARCMLRCCVCCLWCLEACLRPLSADAYTIVALEGKSFFPAAKKAAELISTNVGHVITVSSVTNFIMVFAKLGIMAATGAIAIGWLDASMDLHFPFIPVFFVSFLAYTIASCFLSVYEMVIDTLLMCECEAKQLTEAGPDKQDMTESLMEEENA